MLARLVSRVLALFGACVLRSVLTLRTPHYEFLGRRKTGEEITHTVHGGTNEIIAWSMRSSRSDLYPCALAAKDQTGAVLWPDLRERPSPKTPRLLPSPSPSFKMPRKCL